MRQVEIRRAYMKGDVKNSLAVNLEDNEQVVGVESEGNDYWVYIARDVDRNERDG